MSAAPEDDASGARAAVDVASAAPDATPTGTTEAMSAREVRRAQRLAARRLEVLAAAERLFVVHGYEGTSLEKIAAGAGYSVGAIYNFFPSKDAVYLAVLERNAAVLADRLRECVVSPETGLDKLLAMAATVIREVRANPDRARLTRGSLAPERDASAKEVSIRALLEVYTLAIQEGQLDGTVRAGQPELLAYYVGGLVIAHLGVDPVISNRPVGVPLEHFLEIVRSALELRAE